MNEKPVRYMGLNNYYNIKSLIYLKLKPVFNGSLLFQISRWVKIALCLFDLCRSELLCAMLSTFIYKEALNHVAS